MDRGAELAVRRKMGGRRRLSPADRSAEGLLQGAVLIHGKGRVAVFGEAGMFSAQELTSRDGELIRFGMNAPGAEQNARLVLNVMHWLTGLLDAQAP
jgi:hypothetical protein